jgi:hypothetical protein
LASPIAKDNDVFPNGLSRPIVRVTTYIILFSHLRELFGTMDIDGIAGKDNDKSATGD